MPIRTSLAAIVLFMAGCGAGAEQGTATQPAPEPDSFAVAVAWGNTLDVVGRHENGAWVNTWPEPEDHDVPVPPLDQVPRAWLGGPVPSEWTVWFTSGGRAPVRVAETSRDGGCVASPTLTLDSEPVAPRDQFDESHLGIATTNGKPVLSVQRLTDRGPEWNEVSAFARMLFTADRQQSLETQVRQFGDEYATMLTPDRLAAIPITTYWAFRATDGTTYAETGKRMTTPEGGWIGLMIRAWIRRTPDNQLTASGVTPFLTRDYDRVTPLPGYIPLGVISTPPGAVWVFEETFIESGNFHLIEVTASDARTVLTVDGGGC